MAMHGHVILQYQQQATDAKSIRPYQTAGDVGSIIAHRSSVTFVNRQVLSARALHPKKKHKDQAGKKLHRLLRPTAQLDMLNMLRLAGGDWKS